MPRLHLTDLVVQRLSAIGIYYDTKNPAFGLRVGKNRKAWVITRGTDRQRITVGHYPAMPLADARKAARKLLTEPLAKHAGMRFEEAYGLFERQHIECKKPRTQRDYKRMIERHLAPQLGTKRLVEISYEDVTAITDKLPTSERAHCLAVGRMFFRWCVQPHHRQDHCRSGAGRSSLAQAMALPRFIDIDGGRYLWCDLVADRGAPPRRRLPRNSRLCSPGEDHRPPGERNVAKRHSEPNLFTAPVRSR